MVADLLHPATPELARRWLSALLLVPPESRADVVARVEARIVATYATAHAARAREEIGLHDDHEALGEEAPPHHIAADSAIAPPEPTIEVIHPPRQRNGYVEQVITTYDRPPTNEAAKDISSDKPKTRGRKRA